MTSTPTKPAGCYNNAPRKWAPPPRVPPHKSCLRSLGKKKGKRCTKIQLRTLPACLYLLPLRKCSAFRRCHCPEGENLGPSPCPASKYFSTSQQDIAFLASYSYFITLDSQAAEHAGGRSGRFLYGSPGSVLGHHPPH